LDNSREKANERGGSVPLYLRICLFPDSGDHDLVSLCAGGVEDKERETSISGNEARRWLRGIDEV